MCPHCALQRSRVDTTAGPCLVREHGPLRPEANLAETASGAARVAWGRPSVDVRWRPQLAVAIVTHLVTQSFVRALPTSDAVWPVCEMDVRDRSGYRGTGLAAPLLTGTWTRRARAVPHGGGAECASAGGSGQRSRALTRCRQASLLPRQCRRPCSPGPRRWT